MIRKCVDPYEYVNRLEKLKKQSYHQNIVLQQAEHEKHKAITIMSMHSKAGIPWKKDPWLQNGNCKLYPVHFYTALGLG